MRLVFATTKAEREDSVFKVAMETVKLFDNPERLFIAPVAVKPSAPRWPCDRRLRTETCVTAATLSGTGGTQNRGHLKGGPASLYCLTEPSSNVLEDRCVLRRGTSSYLPWRRSLAAAAIFHCC